MSGFGKKEKSNKLYSMFIMRKFRGKWDFGFFFIWFFWMLCTWAKFGK